MSSLCITCSLTVRPLQHAIDVTDDVIADVTADIAENFIQSVGQIDGWPSGMVTGSVIDDTGNDTDPLLGTFDVAHRNVDDQPEPAESQLLALPFLPASHIDTTFQSLKVRVATSEPLFRLVTYIERQWITSGQFPPSSWSAFQLTTRTNNDVEGWHYRMNHRAGQAGLGVYRLVPLLRCESELVHANVTSGDIRRDVRSGTARLERRLQEYWTQYMDRELSTSTFLRRCASAYRPYDLS